MTAVDDLKVVISFVKNDGTVTQLQAINAALDLVKDGLELYFNNLAPLQSHKKLVDVQDIPSLVQLLESALSMVNVKLPDWLVSVLVELLDLWLANPVPVA